MVAKRAKRLVLFDIDETIMRSDGAGRRAVTTALHVLLGVPAEAVKVVMSGKTDPQIMHEILTNAGYPEEEQEKRVEELIERYLIALESEIASGDRYKLHLGASELIAALHEREDVELGLLTGNVERGARMKLSKFDLNRYFPIGAYGSDSRDRLKLPAIAHKRAQDHYGQPFELDEIVIIGDAENDILCAKGYGVVSLAVNTGRTSKAELEALSPDHLFATLEDTETILAAIFEDHSKRRGWVTQLETKQ